jgi:aryl-alcohol dehydrogenase-like predicted oxidoreductase
MQECSLGRTGLRVSQVSLGTVELGLDYGIAASGDHRRPSAEEAGALLHAALDAGVNLIDTARAYGTSEELIGRHLQHRRNEFVLVTKVPTFLAEETTAKARTASMQAAVEESLRHLRTGHADVLLLHCGAEDYVLQDECLEALEHAKNCGRARFIGASVYGPEAALAAIGSGVYDCVQVAYSVLDRRVEDAVLPAAVGAEIGLMFRSVLMRGALTERWTVLPAALEDIRAAAARLQDIASDAGIDLPELAYRYVLTARGPFTALAGTARTAELLACISYCERGPLPAEVVEQVRCVVVDARLLDLSRWPPV